MYLLLIFLPNSGPIGKDLIECPVNCPCKADDLSCPQGEDANGCIRGNMCLPMEGGEYYPPKIIAIYFLNIISYTKFSPWQGWKCMPSILSM